jgi:hypothetical protein
VFDHACNHPLEALKPQRAPPGTVLSTGRPLVS